MKKLFAFISVSLIAVTAMFAEVTVKKVDGGKLEATFFYGNPRATEVLLAGDFTSWQDGALPMTKTDKGFTLTKVFDAGTTLKYKFISDGNWTTDLRAPDFVDDGFGGKNGLAELDSLAGGSDDGAGAPKAGIKFQTWSNFGFQQKWDTVKLDGTEFKNDFTSESAGLNLKSYWKFGGKVTPHVPVYVELAVAEKDSFDNIYKKDTLKVQDGLKRLLVDNIFDTIAFYNGEGTDKEKTYLGHFKTGIETPYVVWTTGYKYAKLPPHNNVNWVTVDQEWEAGYNANGGYNEFKTGVALNDWLAKVTDGALKMELVLAPNRSADRAGTQYGFYGYFNTTILEKHYIDLQMNTALGRTYDTLFDDVLEQDFILGYKGVVGPVTIKLNGLLNAYGTERVSGGGRKFYAPPSSDVGAVNDDPKNKIDNAAMNANVTFANDMVSAMVGYRFRGAQASMMYVEEGADDHTNISDQLGDRNHQRIFAKVSVTPIEALTVELKPWVQMNLMKEDSPVLKYKNKDNIELSIAPKVTYKISDTMTIDGGFELRSVTKSEDKYVHGSKEESTIIRTAGLHYNAKFDGAVSSLDLTYGFNNKSKFYGMHSLVASIGVPAEVEVQAGIGIRQALADVPEFSKTGVQPFGFSLGANKVINKKYKTVLNGEFLYNFNPYKDFGDQWFNYKLDGYIVDRKAEEFWTNAAAFRVGLSFDF